MVGIPLDEVFLLLFGTGIRGFNSEVTATLDGKPLTVLGAAEQSEFAGLDQVNLGPVPRDFADRKTLKRPHHSRIGRFHHAARPNS